jgi:hypothetical protein
VARPGKPAVRGRAASKTTLPISKPDSETINSHVQHNAGQLDETKTQIGYIETSEKHGFEHLI